jgi:hypothetical protein
MLKPIRVSSGVSLPFLGPLTFTLKSILPPRNYCAFKFVAMNAIARIINNFFIR